MTPPGPSGRRLALGLPVDDEVAVADRLVADGELHDAVEHQPSTAGDAPVVSVGGGGAASALALVLGRLRVEGGAMA
jgi:hypothetical protein